MTKNKKALSIHQGMLGLEKRLYTKYRNNFNGYDVEDWETKKTKTDCSMRKAKTGLYDGVFGKTFNPKVLRITKTIDGIGKVYFCVCRDCLRKYGIVNQEKPINR